ncbi:MAG: hypothetical protein RSB44_09765 [Carnobacterium sp.]
MAIGKAMDCMVQHIKVFHSQAMNEVIADFGEPCQTCPHIAGCNHNWLSTIQPLLIQSTVEISMVHQGLPDKLDNDDNDPDQDMDIHQQEGSNKHPSCSQV